MEKYMKLKTILESLIITSEHLRQARGNKHNFIVEMPAMLFLQLTTTSGESLQDIVDEAQSTDIYNKAAESGKNIIMPFLFIEGDKIYGHEGRHRAASLLKDDKRAKLQVSIRYRGKDKEEEKRLADKHGTWRTEYDVDFEDMPYIILGQFGRGSMTKSNMKFIRHLQK